MSNVVPVPIIDPIDYAFDFPDFQPFSARTGIGYQDQLEAIRYFIERKLSPYILTLPTGLQGQLNTFIGTINTAVDAALAAQDTRYAQTLAEIIAGANNGLNAGLILAALEAANSTALEYLDNRYDAKGVADTRYDLRFQLAQVPSKRNTFTGWYHVDDYGAVGDGATDDRAAIQQAVIDANARYQATNSMQKVYIGASVYCVGADAYYLDNNGGQSGITSITLLDGVELGGVGTIKTKTNAYGNGALYGVIRSKSSGLSHAIIRDITIDGNKDNNPHSVQCTNILLECFTDILIENVTSQNANGMGVMVRGTTNLAMSNVRVIKCDVEQCTAIGIQASQFSGLQILDNVVNGTGDNCIDVYGENGTTISNGTNFTIARNHCFNGSVGVFLETVSTGKCDGNLLETCGVGIHVNRINGQPNKLLITGNEIINCQEGINGTGDTGGVTIRGNLIEGFHIGGCTFGGAGNVSGYYIFDNTMNAQNDDNTIPLVLFKSGTAQTAQMVHMRTITRSKNRATDTVNAGPATVNCTWTPALSPGDTVVLGQ